MDDDPDDKDDTKRKSRNLSEKKRRDQFNMLINELNSMVSNTSRKMDKSTVLKSAISFLRNQNERSVRSREHEIQEDWKPSFLTNEEFTHIILESIDGFIVVFSLSGHIVYTSGSVTSLLGYLPSDLMNNQMSLTELVCEEDHQLIYDVLSGSRNGNYGKDNPVEICLRMRRGPPDVTSEPVYELVHLVGYFRGEKELPEQDNMVSSTNLNSHDSGYDDRLVFVGTGRLIQSYPIGEVTFACEATRSEFSSRHNLDWKFLALDSRATAIIGYVQIEVVGTSGYDYYHVDDLDNIVACHESLMEKGEGTSCFYRFLTKGQQWVWLQTRYYISYHQWNAKPEFVVCSHRVISYVDVMLESRKHGRDQEDSQDDLSDVTHSHDFGFPAEKLENVLLAPPSKWISQSKTLSLFAPNESRTTSLNSVPEGNKTAEKYLNQALLNPCSSRDAMRCMEREREETRESGGKLSRSEKTRRDGTKRSNEDYRRLLEKILDVEAAGAATVGGDSSSGGGVSERSCSSFFDLSSSLTTFMSSDDALSRGQMQREAPLPELSSDSASLSEDSHFSRASLSTLGRHSRRALRSPRSHTSSRRCMPASSPTESRTYLKAVPLLPLLPAYPTSPVPHPQLVTQAAPLTDEVKKKQQELDQLRQLMSQKEEELQQFVNAQSRYQYPPSLLNVSVAFPGPAGVVGADSRQLVTLLPAGAAVPAPVTQEYLVQSTSSTDPPMSQGSVHNLDCDEGTSYDESRPSENTFNSPPPRR